MEERENLSYFFTMYVQRFQKMKVVSLLDQRYVSGKYKSVSLVVTVKIDT